MSDMERLLALYHLHDPKAADYAARQIKRGEIEFSDPSEAIAAAQAQLAAEQELNRKRGRARIAAAARGVVLH